MGNYLSRIIPQGNHHAPAIMVRGMYEIIKDMIFEDLVIYIDDNIILSDTYDKDVANLGRVLPLLIDEMFWLKTSKC